MSLGYDDYTSRKNRKKIIRTVLEFIILAVLLYIVVTAIVVFKDYQPYNDTNTDYAGDKGFVGISYFGVDRIGNESLIGLEQLEHHLEVLKKNGYVTITGKDVESYYKTGRQLPRRSMYLMFEDGRRDTAIFAEKLFKHLGLYERDNQQKTDPLTSLLKTIAGGTDSAFKPVAQDPEHDED